MNLDLMLKGWRLTTAEILYRLPDHPSLLQSYVWQELDLLPDFPALKKFLDFAMSQGLLEVRILDESKFYFVTQKGFKFLKLYEELQDIIAPKDDKEFRPVIENS